MMRTSRLLPVVLVALACVAGPVQAVFCSEQDHALSTAELVIYTYDSLFQWPEPYDFVTAFANASGIAPSDIEVFCFEDAGTLLDEAMKAVNSTGRAPDVVIGLDNVLQFESAHDLLIEYESPNQAQIFPWLLEALDHSGAVPLIPYDYSVISLVIDMNTLNVSASLRELVNSTDFELDTLVQYAGDLLPRFVTQDPASSGTGSAFLLWTIATYGDPELGIVGAMGEGHDWRDFWKARKAYNARVADSWSHSWQMFEDDEYSIISSYLTDGAYDLYANNERHFDPTLSHHNGKAYGWLNIEGLGITYACAANATRFTLCKQFVDWFIDVECQSHIPLHQWTYPANKNVPLPDLYYEAGAVVDNITYANEFITNTQLRDNYQRWIDEVESTLVPATPTPSASTVPSATPTSAAAATATHALLVAAVAAAVAGVWRA